MDGAVASLRGEDLLTVWPVFAGERSGLLRRGAALHRRCCYQERLAKIITC
jgi:hypothetical protein